MTRAIYAAAAVLTAVGCACATDLNMGNWKGTFQSQDGNQGEVAAQIIARGGGKYDGRFLLVTSQGANLTLPFRGETKDGKVVVTGKVDLGSDRGGVVSWTGEIADGKFEGTFKGHNDGTFSLERIEKKPPTLGAAPPENAVVLFDGKSLENWQRLDGKPATWELVDGAMRVRGGSIVSKQQFTDMKIHLEFRTPFMPEAQGQGRGNSGVYVHGRYEVQVLDSFGEEPRDNEAGGIYQVAVPKVNASLPPGEWQTYDITFYAPKYEGNTLVEPAEITVVYNGETIHDKVKLPKPTPGGIGTDPSTPGGIMLQDHSNPVEFRNIWVLPLEGKR